MLKKYDEISSEIRYLLRLASNKSAGYDKKYMKTITKSLERYKMIIALWSVFSYSNKYYIQVFLDQSLFKLAE